MTSSDRPRWASPPKRTCVVPWVLLALLAVGLAGAIYWGYSQRGSLAEYALSSLLEKELSRLEPGGGGASKWADRLAAVVRAVHEGRIDPVRLEGAGPLFRECYADRRLDAQEFESLLSYVEAAVEP